MAYLFGQKGKESDIFSLLLRFLMKSAMQSLDAINLLVRTELSRFEEIYVSILKSKCDLLNSSVDTILAAQGKKIRPLLNLLAAKACGDITETTINSAVLLELLHTATLLHDDVVDDTLERRGKPSINAAYGNKVAVLVGDYFLSTALIMAMNTSSMQLVSIVSNTGRDLSEGEIFQLESTRARFFTEERYYDIIFRKTASLFSACCQIGAITGNDNAAEKGELFKEYGHHIGMAFQIKDDIFDYFEDKIGKPTGNDLREGKVTLPLLYALNKAGDAASQSYKEMITRKEFTPENIAALIGFAKNEGGVEYAEAKMQEHINKAVQLLSAFPDSEAKTALCALSHFIGSRKY